MTATTIHISQDGVYAGTGELVRHPDGTVTVEDCYAILGPDGLDHESGEQQEAAERAYAAIEAAIARGESSVEVEGCTYTWEIAEPPTIRVLGLGDEDWDSDEYADSWETEDERRRRESRREWQRYGTVRVQIGNVEYQVGCCIGVPEHLRATAEAAGGDTTRPAYLDAWYVDASDWSCAPASQGPEGVPRELADAVLAAIYDARVRLWREYEEGQQEGGPMIRWTELSMYVDGASQPIDVATLADRVEWDGDRPTVIHGVMLAAPGEDPDWDTPRVPVDWSGFRAAVEAAQPTREATT